MALGVSVRYPRGPMALRPPSRILLTLGALVHVACGDDPLVAGIDAVDGGDLPSLGETADDAEVTALGDTASDGQVAPADANDTTPVEASDANEPADTTTVAPDTGVADSGVVADTSDALDTLGPPDILDTLDTSDALDTSAQPDTSDTSDTTETAPEDLPPADQGELSAPPYLMWVTPTEVSVRWETKTPLVGRVDFGPDDALGETIVEPAATTTHELRLTGLTPDREHSYRVVYGGGALPIRRFHTAPPEDSREPFRFIVWGDNQDGPETFTDLMPVMADVEPRFAISVGDCVQNGTRAEYRSQLFGPMAGFADQVPYLVAAGNHERYGDPSASLFEEYFSQPGDEHCFGWRYGGLFVLFIDSELELDGTWNQRACIERELGSEAARTAAIRAAAFHKPPRIEWWFGGYLAFPDSMEAPWVREELEPLLESLDVDVVFNGHNHLYAHTPETPGGITWVTTGGGGGRIDNRGLLDIWRVGRWPEIETTIHEFHFLVATLDGDELLIEAIDLDGLVMHSFVVFGD